MFSSHDVLEGIPGSIHSTPSHEVFLSDRRRGRRREERVERWASEDPGNAS